MKVLVYKSIIGSFYKVFFVNRNNYKRVLTARSVNKKFTRKYLNLSTITFQSEIGEKSFTTPARHLYELIQVYDI